MTTDEIALLAGIRPRTLRDHLAGKHPISAAEASAILRALTALGAVLIPEVEELLVIRSLGDGNPPFNSGHEVLLARVRADTIWVVFDPHPNQRAMLQRAVEATFAFRRRKDGHESWPYQLGGVLLRPRWAREAGESRTWKSVQLQLQPWRAEHRRVFQDLLRRLRVEATIEAARLGRHFEPVPVISRIDVACDYQIAPTWLLLDRPRVRTFENIRNEDGGITYEFGRRGRGGRYLRIYDGQHRHPDDELSQQGPWTRIELEARPSKNARLGELADALRALDAFGSLRAALRAVAGLSFTEMLWVNAARELGWPYVMSKLSPGEQRRANEVRRMLASSDARIPTIGTLDDRVIGEVGGHPLRQTPWWELVAEQARYLLLYDPNEEPDEHNEDGARRWDDPELLATAFEAHGDAA